MTSEFLVFQNMWVMIYQPRSEFEFPGLKAGDLVSMREQFLQAHYEGCAPKVNYSTHQRATEVVPLEILELYSQNI